MITKMSLTYEWLFVRFSNVKGAKKKPKAKTIPGKRPTSKPAKPQPIAVPAALER
jgi:hypothetical protein